MQDPNQLQDPTWRQRVTDRAFQNATSPVSAAATSDLVLLKLEIRALISGLDRFQHNSCIEKLHRALEVLELLRLENNLLRGTAAPSSMSQEKENDARDDQEKYKTEICKHWNAGFCTLGDKCKFAHGPGELRPVLRPPQYKTIVCRTILAGNVCPYGDRCNVLHDLTEERLKKLN